MIPCDSIYIKYKTGRAEQDRGCPLGKGGHAGLRKPHKETFWDIAFFFFFFPNLDAG